MVIHTGVIQRQLFDFYHDDTISCSSDSRAWFWTETIEDKIQLSEFRCPNDCWCLTISRPEPTFLKIASLYPPIETDRRRRIHSAVPSRLETIRWRCSSSWIWTTACLKTESPFTRTIIRHHPLCNVTSRQNRRRCWARYITDEGMIDFFVMFFEIQDVQVLHSLFAENVKPKCLVRQNSTAFSWLIKQISWRRSCIRWSVNRFDLNRITKKPEILFFNGDEPEILTTNTCANN